jgi:catechol 2,3-dioxygenase-like lactoylglutathione lyase family enzyme
MKTRCLLSLLVLPLFVFQSYMAKAQILDDIHYYVADRKGLNDFFEKNFGAKQMADQPMNPLGFINFLQIQPKQTTINISPQGPFPGIRVGDPKRWEKSLIKNTSNSGYLYGAIWTCLSTKNLAKSVATLKKNGVEVLSKKIKLPTDPTANAVIVWTPEYNPLVLVERKKGTFKTKYAIDHVQFLVEKLEPEVKFYEQILGAKVLAKEPHTTKLLVGNHVFVLSEPEGLVVDRETVKYKEASKFYPGIDHIGFLYKDAQGMNDAYDKAVKAGYKGLMKPTQMLYFDKPTPYTFGIIFSPSGFQVEFEIESGGRYGPRTVYQK